MFTDLKPYPVYSESVSIWLGTMPAHWAIRRLDSAARIRSEIGRPDLDLLSVYLGRGVIPYAQGGKRVHAPSLDLTAYQVVHPGDLVLNNQQAWRGSVGVSVHQGIISPAYVVLSLDEAVLPTYGRFLFPSSSMVSQFLIASKGVGDIQRQLHQPYLKNVLVPIPPAEEQAAIVKYLGHANARIDRAIVAKRKLIALLGEQKQAIINQAVTRGLDPTVHLEDSGIPWLREFPAHWGKARLKNVAAVQTGLTLGKGYGAMPLKLFSYLRVANVQDSSLDLREVTTVAVPAREAEGCKLAVMDVLMTEGGDIDKLGRATVWRGEVDDCLHQNHVFAVRCTSRVDPEYLVALLGTRIGRHYFYVTAKKTTNLASTNSTTLRAFSFALPDRQEQSIIMDFVRAEAVKFDELVQRLSSEIQLLREFRTRLTADVVTGQLDIRDAAARLPELDPADLVSDVIEQDEDDLEAELAASLEEVDA
jgi:type I restriction enzyme, S subunit